MSIYVIEKELTNSELSGLSNLPCLQKRKLKLRGLNKQMPGGRLKSLQEQQGEEYRVLLPSLPSPSHASAPSLKIRSR